MRARLTRWLTAFLKWLQPKPAIPDVRPELAKMTAIASELALRNTDEGERYRREAEQFADLVEARGMVGQFFHIGAAAIAQTDKLIVRVSEALGKKRLREGIPPISAGAFGDIELALQNVEWRREVNFSWLEFSRWGIQQIILISRLYYIKNPIIRRLIDVGAAYTFARGCEISSPDDKVTEIIDAFIAANPKVLGHMALTKSEKRKDYDGNLYWCFFDDRADTGETSIRMIDATEIEEIISDPEDADTPWYYLRIWADRPVSIITATQGIDIRHAWYPALDYDPPEKPETMRDYPVMWNSPVYHSKSGDVAQWHFGCPRAYPALEWAKEARRYLEACASVKQSNAQIAREITTKGGQQAIEGMKQQLQTTVGPSAAIWDQNPAAVSGSTWVSGPGTTNKLVAMRNMSDNPEEVRRYLLMCCMCFGVPETFLGDVSTGNLATATSLDRPTETVMLEKQEAWREDLIVIVMHHLNVSKAAPGGKLREVLSSRGLDPGKVTVRECRRVRSKDGTRMHYATLEMRKEASGTMVLHEAGKPVKTTDIVVRVNFPAIREGDLRLLVDAAVQAATLGNRAGQIIGTDEKETVRHLFNLQGYDNADELTEEMYPKSKYKADRFEQSLPAPIKRPPVGLPAGTNPGDLTAETAEIEPGTGSRESSQLIRAAMARLTRATKAYEAAHESNGHVTHPRA